MDVKEMGVILRNAISVRWSGDPAGKARAALEHGRATSLQPLVDLIQDHFYGSLWGKWLQAEDAWVEISPEALEVFGLVRPRRPGGCVLVVALPELRTPCCVEVRIGDEGEPVTAAWLFQGGVERVNLLREEPS